VRGGFSRFLKGVFEGGKMNKNGYIKKKELRRLYPQGARGAGPQRQRLTTTQPPEVMAALRKMVAVGKGGEAAPLVALSLELTTALLMLNDGNATEVIPRLQEVGRKLGSIARDRADVALALSIVASKVEDP
jgi:hypothetical protein